MNTEPTEFTFSRELAEANLDQLRLNAQWFMQGYLYREGPIHMTLQEEEDLYHYTVDALCVHSGERHFKVRFDPDSLHYHVTDDARP